MKRNTAFCEAKRWADSWQTILYISSQWKLEKIIYDLIRDLAFYRTPNLILCARVFSTWVI